jgi:phosphatidylinositol 3-kinase
MIRTNGQLFHIDFGFIFGRDPKPLPPPFRFTRHMADAMGGEESDHYKKFQSYCCQAYNWLRKSANLILNLLSLMVDAGIPDLSVRQDPAIVLKKVEEKFRLDLTGQFPPVPLRSLPLELIRSLPSSSNRPDSIR